MSTGPNIKVSCAIFTLNEGINLPKCLKSLAPICDDVVVIDSFSSDQTEAICRQAGVRFVQHTFTGFGDQRNWALENIDFRNEWIFILDADEAFTPELIAELQQRLPQVSPEVAAFRVKRKLYMWGRWLRYSSLYPTWVIRLIRRGKVRYVNRGHAETQVVQGRIEALEADLRDENLKGIHAWFERQNEYSSKEAIHESSQTPFAWWRVFSPSPLERREALKTISRGLPFRAFIFFFYSYVLRRGFLDGRAGFYFSLMKAIYTEMIELKKLEIKTTGASSLEAGDSHDSRPLPLRK